MALPALEDDMADCGMRRDGILGSRHIRCLVGTSDCMDDPRHILRCVRKYLGCSLPSTGAIVSSCVPPT